MGLYQSPGSVLYHGVQLRTVRVVVLKILHRLLDLGNARQILVQSARGSRKRQR